MALREPGSARNGRAVAWRGRVSDPAHGTVLAKLFARTNPTAGDSIMFSVFTKLLRNEDGATAIEYGLIAALISVAAITAFTAVGSSLTSKFNNVSSTL